MKIWLSKSSDVPIQEQLSTQLILGIVSADLAPGERLPSTSELARRFRIHPNTVRAAYRELAQRGWAEWKRGSGFYVRGPKAEKRLDPSLDLDHLISTFFDVARGHGHSLKEIQSRVVRWFSLQPPDHILVIEPDPELRDILIAEIKAATTMRTEGTPIEDCSQPRKVVGALCVALYDHAEEVRAKLPAEQPRLFLHSRSIAKSLAAQQKPAKDTVITVISRWPDFLQWARTTLVAVGLDPESLDLRDAREKRWERGLNGRSFIVTESVTAGQLPAECRPRVFQVIADESLQELRGQLSTFNCSGAL